MIYNTYLKNTVEVPTELKGTNLQEAQLLLAKYKQMLLAQLKIGDSLQGMLTKGEGTHYTLELKQGIKLPVALLGEAEIGKLLEFIVQKNEGNKLSLTVKDGEQQNLLEKVITSLNLPRTEEMAKCIKAFVEGNLALDKDALLQSHYLHKKLELPMPVITNLLEKVGMLDMSSLEKIQDLKQGGLLELIDKLKGIIETVPQKENLFKLLDTLTMHLPKDVLKEVLNDVLVMPKFTGKAQDIGQNMKSLENNPQSLVQNAKLLEASPEFLKIKGDSPELLKIKEDFPELYAKVINKEQLNVLKEPILLKEVLFKVLDKLTLFNGKEMIKQSTSEEGQAKPIIESYKHLSKIVNDLEKFPLEAAPKQQLSEIRETLSTLGKLNVQADYFMFPFVPSQEKLQGELYFFKPKRKNKKNKEEIYAVLALDLPALNHIEIHVKKHGKQLELGVHTGTKSIQDHMIKHMPKLGTLLEDMGYTIEHCRYKLLDEVEKGAVNLKEDIQLTSLDLKV